MPVREHYLIEERRRKTQESVRLCCTSNRTSNVSLSPIASLHSGSASSSRLYASNNSRLRECIAVTMRCPACLFVLLIGRAKLKLPRRKSRGATRTSAPPSFSSGSTRFRQMLPNVLVSEQRTFVPEIPQSGRNGGAFPTLMSMFLLRPSPIPRARGTEYSVTSRVGTLPQLSGSSLPPQRCNSLLIQGGTLVC